MEGDHCEPNSQNGTWCAKESCVPGFLTKTVNDLIYWRDLKASGITFGSTLVLLLSMTYFSIILVLSSALFLLLAISFVFRVYKYALQTVQKSNEGHPFKQYLDLDLTINAEHVKKMVDVAVPYVNSTVERLRSLFLVEDIVDTIKLAIVLWLLTYVGSWFNGMTLIILADILVFSLPKVYETYKAEIDAFICLVLTTVKENFAKIRAKIPIGNKKKEE
jgi:hypothetical protein